MKPDGENWEIPEKGFTIIFSDDFKEASVFDLGKEECSKLIKKEDIESFWKEIMECNFQKVLLENESMQGCDGYNSKIELDVGQGILSLSLWCPDLESYKERNLSESVKLLKSINSITSYVARQNIAKNFKF